MESNVEIDSIVNVREDNVEKFKLMAEIEESKWYENSYYYGNYMFYINQINSICQNVLNQIIQQYQFNSFYFNNPYFKDMKKQIVLNIGYPIPKVYLDKLKKAYESYFSKNNCIENSDVKIDIIPCEYLKKNTNMFKCGNFYALEIEFLDKFRKNDVIEPKRTRRKIKKKKLK